MVNKKLTKKERTTINYYDQHSNEWAERHKGGREFDEERDILIKLVPSGKLLEIGTGPGRDAKVFIKHFGINNYTGIEPAKGLIKIALKRNPKVKIQNENVYEMDVPDKYFDAFWSSAVLIHIPKNKINRVLKKIKRAMKKGSYGYISVMEGNVDMEEGRTDRFFSLWGQEEFEKELSVAGFKIYKKRRIVRSKGSPWLAYLVKIT